jgi:hypothetical protein
VPARITDHDSRKAAMGIFGKKGDAPGDGQSDDDGKSLDEWMKELQDKGKVVKDDLGVIRWKNGAEFDPDEDL